MGKVIPWELYLKGKIDHVYKWYIENTEYVLENETQNIFLVLEIKMNLLILAKIPNLLFNKKKKKKKKKKNLSASRFWLSTIEWVEKAEEHEDDHDSWIY